MAADTLKCVCERCAPSGASLHGEADSMRRPLPRTPPVATYAARSRVRRHHAAGCDVCHRAPTPPHSGPLLQPQPAAAARFGSSRRAGGTHRTDTSRWQGSIARSARGSLRATRALPRYRAALTRRRCRRGCHRAADWTTRRGDTSRRCASQSTARMAWCAAACACSDGRGSRACAAGPPSAFSPPPRARVPSPAWPRRRRRRRRQSRRSRLAPQLPARAAARWCGRARW